ncbi:FAD-linked oxidase-like protein [Cryphonectria parasitica EP155]|uniref:FAD-linked oxidase-like protein n=1 Tax=Cryphonectria parasitica (strain ATCC 38755 / EP155) TaxID=660469 RepID=A0A9P5CMT4_CRYP1|nr:FAD-linked oxidase-like protein [Cryphonectria parasitica EP155]KAF3763592.1 FAD-linked oxidase-like protein [Cryphonectria parasitica EP155]
MEASREEQPTLPPSLEDVYSGSPLRLSKEADTVKKLLGQGRTLPVKQSRRSSLRLPSDVTLEAFQDAVQDLKTQIGPDNVVVNDAEQLQDGWYLESPNTHDAFHIIDHDELVASALVYPGSTEEVQAVVRWANKYTMPIYPISLGRNLGYGGAAPRIPGGVVVDLGKRMHSILKIDAENASCVVEPGVTYFKLYEEIQKRNLALWIDTPDLGGGSVLGNALDRGVGYTPYGDHFANHCGMELVLPNGELLRTGMGAMPGPEGEDNPTWQSFQHAYGPAVEGIFSQSNFGIVTKMGFHLMPPTGHQSYCLTFPRDDDFGKIVDIIRPLAQQRILGNIPQLRHVIQELNVTGNPKATFWSGTGPMPREDVASASRSLPLGECSWVFYGTQYGTPESIQSQLDLIKEAFTSQIPDTRFFLPRDVPASHYLHSRALVCAGVPVLTELNWLNWVPNGAHLFFSPIAPTRSQDARTLHDIIATLHARHGFDLFPTLCVAGREMHYIANIVYDRADREEKRRAVRLMRDMIAACAARGFGEYRTHLLFADQIARTYGWGGQALLRLNETIKDALDPKGILAPGRNGIWPRRFRGRGWELGEEDVDMETVGPRKKKEEEEELEGVCGNGASS